MRGSQLSLLGELGCEFSSVSTPVHRVEAERRGRAPWLSTVAERRGQAPWLSPVAEHCGADTDQAV